MQGNARRFAVAGAGLVLASTTVSVTHPADGHAATADAAAEAPARHYAPLRWGKCADLETPRNIEMECARLVVPLDHDAEARNAAVEIALSRVPARGQATEALLVNPGGPGSSGRFLAADIARSLPDDLRNAYDVIGFDPRGTGASTPALTCDPDFFAPPRPDTVPATDEDEDLLVKRAKAYAEACDTAGGALLAHMRTTDSAHDIDAIRAALGRDRIDYFGYSYGTYLGAVYATLYPDRVRRLVLDSVVHPGRGWYQGNLEQSRSLDAAAGGFFDWIARHEATYGLGSSAAEVAGRYYATRSALGKKPAGGRIGPTELESTYMVATYAASAWPLLAGALADMANDEDPDRLIAAFERLGETAEDEPAFAGYLATECTDARWPRSWSTWHADGTRIHADAPFLGWHNVWYNASCAFWPAEAGEWFQVDGSRVKSALLIHATEDGPTPLDGAYAMHRRFPTSGLVIEDGGLSHGVALSGNECVDNTLFAYLRDGRLPRADGAFDGADRICAALPEPEPRTSRGKRANTRSTPAPGASEPVSLAGDSAVSPLPPAIPSISAVAGTNR
ncbi:alpha/beta fold hydrolase [Nocardiopsis rhodophaea]|uniref:alpha/beta fold hydrolase n=1 Tax=Nocardiopsis rhodophaea TaxID=280238 RepID=UPI0031DE8A86